MEKREEGLHTIAGRDFNARTGELGARQGMGVQQEKEVGRCLKDKVVNGERKILVKNLQEGCWFIFNGNGKGDANGEWTYERGREMLVIDYVVGK